jgi:hypothetical protein
VKDLPVGLVIGMLFVTNDGHVITMNMPVYCVERVGVFITAYPRAGSVVGGHQSS